MEGEGEGRTDEVNERERGGERDRERPCKKWWRHIAEHR